MAKDSISIPQEDFNQQVPSGASGGSFETEGTYCLLGFEPLFSLVDFGPGES